MSQEESLREDLHKAAQFGKVLLEENTELKEQLDEYVKKSTTKLENIQQDLYTVQNKLETKERNEIWLNDEIAQLKAELVKERLVKKDSTDNETERQIAGYKRQITELQSDNEQSEIIREQLGNKITQLESLLQEKMEHNESISKSFTAEEMELHQENLNLKSENTVLKSQLISAQSDVEMLTKEWKLLKERLASKNEETEELQSQIGSYFAALERTKQELMETNAELDALKMLEASDHNKKGNSLFSEVEDRRVAAEKKLVSMKVQFDALKQNYEREREMRCKLKMQMIPLLEMSKNEADRNHITHLEEEMKKANEIIKELQLKLQQSEKNGGLTLDDLNKINIATNSESTEQTMGSDDWKFWKTLLASKEQAIKTLNDEKNDNNLLYLNEKRKVLDLEQKVYQVEKKYEKQSSHNLKLAMKNEELLEKYEPGSVKHDKPIFKKTEKIIIPDVEEDKNASIVIKENVKFVEPLRRRTICPPPKVLDDTTSSLNILSCEDDKRKRSINFNSLGKTKSVSICSDIQILNDDCEKNEDDELNLTVLKELQGQTKEAPVSHKIHRNVKKMKSKIKPISLSDLMKQTK